MKKLKNLFKLSCNVKVYVPSTTDVTKTNTTLQDKKVTETMETLSLLFGGATSYNAIGAWVSDTDGLVREKVIIVESYCDTDGLDKHGDSVVELCEKLKETMSQESIALEINGEMYFI